MIVTVSKEVNIIIYPSTDQLYESNIGSFETQQFTLPTFVSKGTRIVLAYNGSHIDLQHQLYEALVRVQWESQLKDGGLQDQAKNSGSNTGGKAKTQAKDEPVPMWFKEGAIKYFASQWPIEAEDKFRKSFEQADFTNWQQVVAYEPRLGGQELCSLLSERYFPTTVAQTFLQMRKKKSLPRAIRLITKHTLDSLYTECFAYYQKRFKTTIRTTNEKTGDGIATTVIPHKKGTIQNLLISPGKEYIAYICGTFNKRTIYIYNTLSHETKNLTTYNLPPWIDEHSPDPYPILAWHKDGKQLYVALPVKGENAHQKV